MKKLIYLPIAIAFLAAAVLIGCSKESIEKKPLTEKKPVASQQNGASRSMPCYGYADATSDWDCTLTSAVCCLKTVVVTAVMFTDLEAAIASNTTDAYFSNLDRYNFFYDHFVLYHGNGEIIDKLANSSYSLEFLNKLGNDYHYSVYSTGEDPINDIQFDMVIQVEE
jgi:hypothetical protein